MNQRFRGPDVMRGRGWEIARFYHEVVEHNIEEIVTMPIIYPDSPVASFVLFVVWLLVAVVCKQCLLVSCVGLMCI